MLRKIKRFIRDKGATLVRTLNPGIMSIHCIDPGNIGDMACTPFEYFEADKPIYKMNFWDVDAGLLPSPSRIPVVLGGGGLFYAPKAIERLVTSHKGPVVAWGIGRNNDNPGFRPDYVGVDKFALFGVRDWNAGHEWVPCASCMSPLFDRFRRTEPSHPIVVYQHHAHPLAIGEFPVFANNAARLEDVIRFLASGETVVTNSFHGAYWGHMVGRKVLAIPLSNRFTARRFKPMLTSIDSWAEDLRKAEAYPEALEVCRERTMEFARKVEERIGANLRLKFAS
jgi:hypothetical protein